MLSGEHAYPAVLVQRLLVAMLNNRHLSDRMLSALGMLPRRRRAGEGAAAAAGDGAGDVRASSSSSSGIDVGLLVQVCLEQLKAWTDAAAEAGGQAGASAAKGGTNRSSSSGGGGGPGAVHSSSSRGSGEVCAGASSSAGVSGGSSSSRRGTVEELLMLLVDTYLPGRLQAMVDHRTRLAAAGAATSSSGFRDPSNTGSRLPAAGGAAMGGGRVGQGMGDAVAGAVWDVPPTGVNLHMLGVLLVPLATGESSGVSVVPPGGGVLQLLGPALVQALGRVLQQQQGMPPIGLWLAGWLLYQLLPATLPPPAAGGAVASDAAVVSITAQSGELSLQQQQQQQLETGLYGSSSEGLGNRLVGAMDGDDSTTAAAAAAAEVWGGAVGSSSLAARGLADGRTLTATSDSSAVSGFTDYVSCAGNSFLGTPLPSVTSVGMAGGSSGSSLPAELQELMQQQVQQVQQQFCRALGGMWCEALVPMVAMEWPAAREMLLRPVLRASTEALLSGSYAHPLLQQGGGGGGGVGGGGSVRDSPSPVLGFVREGLSVSAKEAVASYSCVQRVVALQQIEEVGGVGERAG